MNRHIRRAQDDCDRVTAAMTKLRRALPELERRNRFAAGNDGYSGGSTGPGQRGVVAQPTEKAALSPPTADPVRQWTRDALRALEDASQLATTIDNLVSQVLAGAEPVALCSVCRRPGLPRLVDERCDACYKYRARNGRDREAEGVG